MARNNYYHDIDGGAVRVLGHEITAKAAVSLTHDGLLATCNIGSQEHELVVGQVVHVTNARINGELFPVGSFNGYLIVKSVGVGAFTYEMTADPGANADTVTVPEVRPNPPGSAVPIQARSLIRKRVNGVATSTAIFDTGNVPHGFIADQEVLVEKAVVRGNPTNLFNGIFPVTPTSATTFTYDMTGVPNDDAQTPPDFRPVSQDANLSIENNVIELALGRLQGYWSNPSGIQLGISNEEIPYTYRQVLLRENVIRQIDGQADTSHYGIIVKASEKLQVDNNVIDVGGGGVLFKKSVAPNFSNNLSPAGILIRGYDEATAQSRSELASRIEDALILSL